MRLPISFRLIVIPAVSIVASLLIGNTSPMLSALILLAGTVGVWGHFLWRLISAVGTDMWTSNPRAQKYMADLWKNKERMSAQEYTEQTVAMYLGYPGTPTDEEEEVGSGSAT